MEGRSPVRLLLLAAGLIALATAAAAQTKNFTAPGGVPNYFSNEAGAPLGSGGIVHPRMPRPEVVEEEAPRARAKVVSSSRRDTRRHVSLRDKRRAAKVAAARAKQRATKLAADKARKAKLAAAKKAATRTAAEAPAKGEPVKGEPAKADGQGRSAPAKPKQPPASPAG
jgi:type IV secretory pathway VirB10-like protein